MGDIKCDFDNVNLMEPLGTGRCFPDGWVQNNNDCWLDSCLYSMFGTTGTTDFYSQLLQDMMQSDNLEIKGLSINIRKYLIGLDNRIFSCGAKMEGTTGYCITRCKQYYKNKISENLIKLAPEVLRMEPWIAETQFEIDNEGNVGNGSCSILFMILAALSDDITYIDPSNTWDLKCKTNIVDRKFIKSVVERLSELDTQSEIVVFDINGIDPVICSDVTRLRELSNQVIRSSVNSNYELLGIIFGVGIHYTTAVKCPRGDDGEWRQYDTGIVKPTDCWKNTVSSGNPADLIDANTFDRSEQAILIYRKIEHDSFEFPAQDGWTCQACTFVNYNMEAPVCKICGTIRDTMYGGRSNYHMITNPITGRKVSITGKLGRNILQKYINQL